MAQVNEAKVILEQRLSEFKANTRRSALDLSGIGLRTDDIEAARAKFQDLSRVKSLYLGKNNKRTARDRSRNSLDHVPAWLFEKATNLIRLDLSGNLLTSVPDTISSCASLQFLNLSENRLGEFPLTVCRLLALSEFDVTGSRNNFRSLPEEYGGLTKLAVQGLNLDALIWPPRDILDQGAPRTVQFISDVVKNGGEVINEAKVVLVGNGDHGKTTLRLWLTENRFVKRPSTQGGDVGELSVQANSLDKKRSGRIKIWDFGGQDQYRAAQRSLFSSDALFVLVCKARGTIEEAGIPEWLQLIEHVNKRAKVLLVFTHMDQANFTPTLENLPERLKKLVPPGNVFQLDATRATGGIKEIKARIESEARGMDSFQSLWPIAELDVRRRLEDLKTKTGQQVIQITEFMDLCKNNGVKSDRVAGVARSISNIDVGPDPKVVVLDPGWLLKAIAYILADHDVQKRNGVLRIDDLDRIWLNKGQSRLRIERDYWKPLLAILAYQGLAYNLNDNEWLVTECVIAERPKVINWTADVRGVRREIRLEAPIFGVAALMVAELHMFHLPGNREFWKTGGFFRDHVSGSELLVQTDGPTLLMMEARGKDAPFVLERANSALRTITNRYWPETKEPNPPPYNEHVPCSYSGCNSGYHVLNAIKTAIKNQVYSTCSTGDHKVQITQLLYGVSPPSDRDELLDQIKKLLENHNATKGEAPRILHVTQLDGIATDERKLRLVCELTGEPVIETEMPVRIEKNWFKVFKTLVIGAAKGAGHAAVGDVGGVVAEGAKALENVIDDDYNESPFLVFPSGFSERRIGEVIPDKVRELLDKMVEMGKMRQVCDRETGKWLWASQQAADAYDPTQPKEVFDNAKAS